MDTMDTEISMDKKQVWCMMEGSQMLSHLVLFEDLHERFEVIRENSEGLKVVTVGQVEEALTEVYYLVFSCQTYGVMPKFPDEVFGYDDSNKQLKLFIDNYERLNKDTCLEMPHFSILKHIVEELIFLLKHIRDKSPTCVHSFFQLLQEIEENDDSQSQKLVRLQNTEIIRKHSVLGDFQKYSIGFSICRSDSRLKQLQTLLYEENQLLNLLRLKQQDSMMKNFNLQEQKLNKLINGYFSSFKQNPQYQKYDNKIDKKRKLEFIMFSLEMKHEENLTFVIEYSSSKNRVFARLITPVVIQLREIDNSYFSWNSIVSDCSTITIQTTEKLENKTRVKYMTIKCQCELEYESHILKILECMDFLVATYSCIKMNKRSMEFYSHYEQLYVQIQHYIKIAQKIKERLTQIVHF